MIVRYSPMTVVLDCITIQKLALYFQNY